MKKILVVLCLCVVSNITFGGDCFVLEESDLNGVDTSYTNFIEATTLSKSFFHCGSFILGDSWDVGCDPGNYVIGDENNNNGEGPYVCLSSGIWSREYPNMIPDCEDDPATEDQTKGWERVDNFYYFGHKTTDGPAGFTDLCKLSQSQIDAYLSYCITSGGAKRAFDCECSDPYENDGPYKCKPKSKFNYKSCSSDSDCTGIDNTVRPYLHSTAWHCAWQSAGVRVCTATACESGWTPINGYCQEDKNTQTPQSENKNANSVPNVKTETKVGTKKPCTDLANMDSNCKCIVVGTVERGGKCVCRDDNQEIKNGKCEWTAKYVAGLESDLDSKFNGLTATIGGFEKNVWRDENGEFNTARLASDSIAGVVLGTVGGIVTANLVKKAQVKQGFEDIGCYIGGQSVAGYGDEFNVGR